MRDRTGTEPNPPPGSHFSRRSFMQTLGVSAAASTLAARVHGVDRPAQDDEEKVGGIRIRRPGPVDVTLRVNGHARKSTIEPSTTLLDTLRPHLDLTGFKEICRRAIARSTSGSR